MLFAVACDIKQNGDSGFWAFVIIGLIWPVVLWMVFKGVVTRLFSR